MEVAFEIIKPPGTFSDRLYGSWLFFLDQRISGTGLPTAEHSKKISAPIKQRNLKETIV